MKQGLRQQIKLPAPRGLLNTAIAPQALPDKYAQDLLNMLPTKGGTVSKRNGVVNLGSTTISGENITEAAQFPKSDGTIETFVYTDAGKVYQYDESGDTYTAKITGLDTDGMPFFTYFQGYLYFVNGIDSNRIYDGTSWSVVQELVEEGSVSTWSDADEITISSGSDLSTRYAAAGTVEITYRVNEAAVSSITRSSSTATVTTAQAHLLTTGDRVRISNATQPEYNGYFTVTVTGATTFTYTVSGSPATPATIAAEPIKAIKGSSAPEYRWQTGFSKGSGIRESQSLRATGARYSYKYTGVARAFSAVKVQYRDSLAGGSWITFAEIPAGNKVPGRTETAEITNLSPSLYQVRLVITAEDNQFISDRVGEFQDYVVSSSETSSEDDASNKVILAASLTRSGGTATFTASESHGLTTNDTVFVYDAAQPEYNGIHTVTVSTATVFTFPVSGDPTTPATPRADLPATIVWSSSDKTTTATIGNTAYSSELQTVTFTADVIPDTSKVEIRRVRYYDSPPPFRYIYASRTRLWALGPGEYPKEGFVADSTRNFVYFTDVSNAATAWFNQELQTPNFINLPSVQQTSDSLVGIAEYNGAQCFIGRYGIYIYGGEDPTQAGAYSFIKRLPIGCIHPKLILSLPNDIAFVSRYGIRTLSLSFQNEQVEALPDLGSSIDPSVDRQITMMLASDSLYAGARSFFYEKSGLYGFKLADETHVYVVQEDYKGWARWADYFSDLTAVYGSLDGRLLLSKGTQLARYADGSELAGTNVYTDVGVNYPYKWFTPWKQIGGKRFNGRGYQVVTSPETAETDLTIYRFKDNNTGDYKQTTITTTPPLAYWDEAFWDEDYWDGRSKIIFNADKYVAYSMAYIVAGEDSVGPVEIVSLDVFGHLERG